MTAYEGGCLCGSVRYAARGAPINERICHCRMCQKALGAAFNARLLFPASAVTVTGLSARFRSSADVERVFCPACGTTLFSARPGLDRLGITVGSLDDPSVFRPTMHIWTSSRQSWLKIDDGLPQFPESTPAS